MNVAGWSAPFHPLVLVLVVLCSLCVGSGDVSNISAPLLNLVDVSSSCTPTAGSGSGTALSLLLLALVSCELCRLCTVWKLCTDTQLDQVRNSTQTGPGSEWSHELRALGSSWHPVTFPH